ncbi:PEGA domain-containing protein [Pyxidicoccus xibeiensis]|uniref:PEGA domain-containing protein n=1 Tax=Pyxidicoccus xibeiensis TaxID=2906759 RepID=UPI0020A71083|nr:PEGA domain-containing protein [Pyxidicoccus xibeiensis]MCP3140584.1 PEGA domain-containing protein [Pyxidicoccus xibeiensis]
MSNAQEPRNGMPAGDDSDRDNWSSSLMGRTDELRHVQSQSDAPVAGTPSRAAAPAGPGGAAQAPSRKVNMEAFAPPPPPPRPVLAALKLGSAACTLVAALVLVLPELQRFGAGPEEPALRIETTLAPSFDAPTKVREGEVGEQRAAIEGGILLMADSEPSGASVSVDGVKQGVTPVSLTLDCAPGAPLRVQFSRRGYDTLEHATRCQADSMTKLSARLRKARGGAKP